MLLLFITLNEVMVTFRDTEIHFILLLNCCQVNVPNKCEIHVRRNNLLLDSYRGVFDTVTNTELLKTRLRIVFDLETGLDYGGLQR